MKKLNRKGFTLIELLAVIVILAIVMVVTIPSVINSMAQARQSQLNNAMTTIIKYVNDQHEKCIVGDTTLTGTFDSSVLKGGTGTDKCDPKAETAGTAALTAAGYTTADITSITSTYTNGKYEITASVIPDTSKFKGATYPER